MSGAGPGWRLVMSLPGDFLPRFEAALECLGGALVTEARDEADRVPATLYLAAEPDPARVTTLLAAAAAASGTDVPAFTAEPLPEIDWVAESEKGLPPIHAGRVYIHGAHVTAAPPAGSLPILIEASLAFGTGRHESTKGCLIALDTLARQRRFRRPLDMGCGSGILAIAIAKLWHVPVLAADIDADAVRLARDNARLNRVGSLVRSVASDGYRDRRVRRAGPYDLIVANILAGPLSVMAADLRRALAPGGIAVLSGLLTTQAQAVLARHRAQGLVLQHKLRLGDWTTLVLRG